MAAAYLEQCEGLVEHVVAGEEGSPAFVQATHDARGLRMMLVVAVEKRLPSTSVDEDESTHITEGAAGPEGSPPLGRGNQSPLHLIERRVPTSPLLSVRVTLVQGPVGLRPTEFLRLAFLR